MGEKIDLDRQVEEEEVLTLTIGGKEYLVADITVDQMEAADKLVNEQKAAREGTNGQRDPYALHKQLALLLGQPPDAFNTQGFRKVQKAMRLIWAHLADQRGEAGKGGPSPA